MKIHSEYDDEQYRFLCSGHAIISRIEMTTRGKDSIPISSVRLKVEQIELVRKVSLILGLPAACEGLR